MIIDVYFSCKKESLVHIWGCVCQWPLRVDVSTQHRCYRGPTVSRSWGTFWERCVACFSCFYILSLDFLTCIVSVLFHFAMHINDKTRTPLNHLSQLNVSCQNEPSFNNHLSKCAQKKKKEGANLCTSENPAAWWRVVLGQSGSTNGGCQGDGWGVQWYVLTSLGPLLRPRPQ